MIPRLNFKEDTTDEYIISQWENSPNGEDDIKILTLEQFTAKVNSDSFNNTYYWIRFIEF